MGKFFAERGTDYGQTGWITAKGELIRCEPYEHDSLAIKITGRPISSIEKEWVRIGLLYGKNLIQFEGKQLTKAQIDALDVWGIMDYVERSRVQLSANFIKAYFA